MEKASGMELDWYKEYWVNTTHTIDYAINSVKAAKKGVNVNLKRVGVMPMPVDVVVTTKKGEQLYYTIPLRIMRGEKTMDSKQKYEVAPKDWAWTHADYELFIPIKGKKIEKIEIDPSFRMADLDRTNNTYVKEEKGKK